MQLRYSLTMTLISIALSSVSAQKGSFDTRLSLKKLDCDNAKAHIQVEVRAHNDAETFLMGDANYRFEYETDKIRAPKIVSQDNFSNQAAQVGRSYGVHNLQGSRELPQKGIVSLNTFYNGNNSDAQKVTTQWASVATLSFDIADYHTPFNVKWHDNNTFPTTGMNQPRVTNSDPTAFEYALENVQAGGNFSNLTVNIAAQCRNSAPAVAAPPVKTRMNKIVDLSYPIYDADDVDAFTVKLISVEHGQLTPSVTERRLNINYMPARDFKGTDEATLELTDKYGNTARATIHITVKEDALVVLNGFSPNNDGVNDLLTIDGLVAFPNNAVAIFDTHGRNVFETKGYKNDWDGKKNGKMLPDGTYYYLLEDGLGETYTGFINLTR